MVAPTRKGRARRTKPTDGRKPPRRFKSKTPAVIADAMDWMLDNPVQTQKKRTARKKKVCSAEAPTVEGVKVGCCGTIIPDLNELPIPCDLDDPPPKVVKKRAPRRKKGDSTGAPDVGGTTSVTEIAGDGKPTKGRGGRKKKQAGIQAGDTDHACSAPVSSQVPLETEAVINISEECLPVESCCTVSEMGASVENPSESVSMPGLQAPPTTKARKVSKKKARGKGAASVLGSP